MERPERSVRTPIGTPLDAQTSEALRLLRSFLSQAQRVDEMESITARLAASSREPVTIVVVGEVSRGKSTLVNALVGDGEVSPVGHGETTGAFLNLRPPTDDLPAGSARIEFADGSRRPIDPGDLANWVCVDGRQLAAAGSNPPLGADVAVVSRYLPELVITDTPGTGGLNEQHARLAIARAQRAGILLMVTDADGVMTRHAAEFLAHCARYVESVVVVVNKIDTKTERQWSTVVAENRRVIAEVDPRLAEVPVVAVSAQTALDAQARGDSPVAERILAASRLEHLLAAVRIPLERVDRLPALNALRLGRTGVQQIIASLGRDLLAASGTPEAIAALEARRRERDDLQRSFDEARWDWDERIDDIRRSCDELVRSAVRGFSDAWTDRILAAPIGRKAAAQELVVQMISEVGVLDDDLRRTLLARCTDLVVERFAAAAIEPSVALIAALGAESRVDYSARSTADALDGRIVSQVTSGARAVLLGLPAIVGGGPLALVGGLGMGVALAGLAVGMRSTAAEANRRSVQAQVARAAGELREHLGDTTQRLLSALRFRAKREFDEALRLAIREATEQAEAARRAGQSSLEERRDRQKSIQHQIDTGERLIAVLDAELARLSH
ncbi:dynamin family protein [Herbiconiux daphne]|uniref:Dynamin family protein n=1 Tax=Herbiconiux daphne TaxID=2970914 RepID=A0ABT2GXF8_9MICO|nr:dynamin family protein [Herbiconiux daphne]MCS5732650.1 dynamin family protein [Herbiconiux daphne]